MLDRIRNILFSHCSNQNRAKLYFDFFEQDDFSKNEFLIQFAGVPRKLGRQILNYNPEEKAFLSSLSPALDDLSAGNLGRFLLAAQKADTDTTKEILLRGDDFEKVCALKALSYRPDAAEFHLDVVNVCRTNSIDTYQALAIDNPYPSQYFTDPEFNQLVLKVTFLGLAFEKIYHLEERCNQDLLDSLLFLYQERTAAGRHLPDACINFLKEKNIL